MALGPGGRNFGDAGVNVLSCDPLNTPVSAVGSGSDTTSQYHNGTFVSWEGRLLKTLGCNVGLRGVRAVEPQTVSDSPRRTPIICLPVGWTPPYNPLTGRRRPRVGKRASRLNLMVVRWGPEHCDGAELVSALQRAKFLWMLYLGLKRPGYSTGP